ncbi:MAG: PAS domain-containing protein [Thalassobaculum sp.]|uniref:PAS domain-containing protein n=1 Tax=Thalassobaculum sp. TaxID=2022740 RepID=UPI0032EC2B62
MSSGTAGPLGGERLSDLLVTPTCRDFVQAWLRWRGDATVPRRGQIALSDIARHLHWLSVLEVRSAEEMIFRLVGTAINASRGRELTGTSLKDLSRPEDWPRRSLINLALAGRPCGLYFRVLFEYSVGGPVFSEYVCLPVFADEEGAPPQLFTIRQPVENVALKLPQLDPAYNRVGDDNRFVDLGAGVPDSDMLPVPLPPLVL